MSRIFIFKISKNGQVTIFIIVAIMIVAVILGVLFLYGEKELKKPKEVGPEQFIKNCIRNAVEDKIQVLLDNGGKYTPTQVINFEGKAYNYLCYQADYYSACFNLYPALEESVEKELKDSTINDVQNCFNILKEDYEDRGFSVSGKAISYEIDILPGNVKINLRYKFILSDGQTSSEFEVFDTRYSSGIYDLIKISREILNAESQFCSFEYSGFMLLYPDFDISKVTYDSSRIYKIKDRKSTEVFSFAVRSCAGRSGL